MLSGFISTILSKFLFRSEITELLTSINPNILQKKSYFRLLKANIPKNMKSPLIISSSKPIS